MSEVNATESTPQQSSTISKDPLVRKTLNRSAKLMQMEHLIMLGDQQEMMAENNRSRKEYNLATDKAIGHLLAERQSFRQTNCDSQPSSGDENVGNKTEDDAGFNADLSESTNIHHHYPAPPVSPAPAQPVAGGSGMSGLKAGVLGAALTAAGVGLPLVGFGVASWLASKDKPDPEPSQVTTVEPEARPAAVQVELFYKDPVKGLVPIPNAADTTGGELKGE